MMAHERISDIVFKCGFVLLWLQPLPRVELPIGLLLASCFVIVLFNRLTSAVGFPAARTTAWWTVRSLATHSIMQTRR